MLIFSCIFIALGVICLILSKVWSIGIQKDEKYKGKTTGTVAEIVSGAPDQAGIAAGIHDYYFPIVAFYANGKLYKLKYEKGSNPCRYKVREKLNIRYDVSDPAKFEIREEYGTTLLYYALYFGGLACCCIGGFFFLLFATRY